MNYRKELSGHMWRGSPMESCDSCGNCDGANCEFCHPVFIADDGTRFTDPSEAQAHCDQVNNEDKVLCANVPEFIWERDYRWHSPDYGLTESLDLGVLVWVRPGDLWDGKVVGKEEYGWRVVQANPEAPTYAEKHGEALEARKKWNTCSFAAQGETQQGTPCDWNRLCCDWRCRQDMVRGRERPIYP